MEQRPEPGLQPYAPPSADVARAYLDESTRVTQRREQYIDRRAAAKLLAVEGVVVAVYLTLMMHAFRAPDMVLLVLPVLIWTSLVESLREDFGYQSRGREQRWRTVLVLAFVALCIAGFWLVLAGADLPLWALLAPGLCGLAMCWVFAFREWRLAVPGVSTARRLAPFDRATRLITALIGILLGASIAAVSSGLATAIWLGYALAMLGLIVWFSMVRAGTAPSVGSAWGPLLWGLYGASSAALAAMFGLTILGVPPEPPVPLVVGAAVAVAFVAVALFGRDHASDS